jgi:hypothetical protein
VFDIRTARETHSSQQETWGVTFSSSQGCESVSVRLFVIIESLCLSPIVEPNVFASVSFVFVLYFMMVSNSVQNLYK